MNWNEKRVLIIGAARQGLATARYLARHGAEVTLNDQRTPEQLASAMQELAGCSVNWVLGSHPLELLDHTDLVCISGGVPLSLPLVVAARQRDLALTNDSQIFMDAVSCPVIGITGSAGKTTTTTLVGRISRLVAEAETRAGRDRQAWVGGNIGNPLIDRVEEIRPQDIVVLELSSFQLEQMTRSPHVAAVLNITPNHLDRHGTLEAYAAAKARILQFQLPNDVAVLNRQDPGAWLLAGIAPGKLVTFSTTHPGFGQPGTFIQAGKLMLHTGQADVEIAPVSAIRLRGEHNQVNVLAAFAIAYAAGFPVNAMAAALVDFHGVAHRLEWVRTWNGAQWYNDSIATAPERTMAAIHSFDEPLVLLLGGRDKNLPWDKLASLVHERVDHVVVFGDASEKILEALGPAEPGKRPFSIDRAAGLKNAVEAAAAVAAAGDVVLLSPGGTSFDEFRDFEERGEVYRKWVNELS